MSNVQDLAVVLMGVSGASVWFGLPIVLGWEPRWAVAWYVAAPGLLGVLLYWFYP